jgi:hypothetical protein
MCKEPWPLPLCPYAAHPVPPRVEQALRVRLDEVVSFLLFLPQHGALQRVFQIFRALFILSLVSFGPRVGRDLGDGGGSSY